MSPPAFTFHFSSLFSSVPSHVIEHPVPDYEETGNDHVGEQSCTEECCGDDDLVVHLHHLYASAVTPSAHVSITVWIDSSSKDEIVTC